MNISKLIDISMKNKKPDLVLKNGNVVNVFSHEILKQDVAIHNGKIVGIGNYDGIKNIDVSNKYIVPGLIDSHVHIESSMLSPREFAKAIIPRGTTTIITDPHEIANVCGIDGINYILNSTEDIPLDVFIMLPSCVPATSFENSGAKLLAKDLEPLMDNPRVLGLGEMMNYPGVIYKDSDVIEKLELSKKYDKIVDGHSPNLTKEGLNAYILSGVKTDHECKTAKEMIEKIRLGMYVLIREGSATKDLVNLMKGLNNFNYQRCSFCTDDKHPEDILKNGHIDNNIKIAIKNGLDPMIAIKMSTINPATIYNLKNKGAISLGFDADILVVDNLSDFNIEKVFKDGILVSENKNLIVKIDDYKYDNVLNTVNAIDIKENDLKIKINSDTANIIGINNHSLITEKITKKVETENGYFKYCDNISKIVVLERHNKTNNIGLGLVKNFDIKNGALASTVAHDSHNIIAIGDNDKDIINAISQVKNMQGGIAISSNNEILDSLDLKIGGLMSDKSIDVVNEKLKNMLDTAYNKLGVNKEIEPFMTLAFLALPVIPEIKITDKGLFDVDKFEFIQI